MELPLSWRLSSLGMEVCLALVNISSPLGPPPLHTYNVCTGVGCGANKSGDGGGGVVYLNCHPFILCCIARRLVYRSLPSTRRFSHLVAITRMCADIPAIETSFHCTYIYVYIYIVQ